MKLLYSNVASKNKISRQNALTSKVPSGPTLENDVTLVCVDCVEIPRAIKALNHCLSLVKFKNIKFLTSIPNECAFSVHINEICSRGEYSKFCLYDLTNYISTDYCLVVQHDGYIINDKAWSNDWFSYDYIGSPFSYNDRVVGNGGFSLRSKRLLERCNSLYRGDPTTHDEDYAICWHWRKRLIESGMNFASLDIARKFGSEKLEEIKDQFGFHNVKYSKLI